MPNLSTLLWQHDSNQPASDKQGAVQFQTAWRTLVGYETLAMIRKG
jgi:hypothetical protein